MSRTTIRTAGVGADADQILAQYHARHAVRSLVCPVCMGSARRRPRARVRGR